jgi:transcription elongation factor GreB
MSRAFVDDDNEQPEGLPEIPQSEHPGYITPAGLAALEAEMERLETAVRPPLVAEKEAGEANAARAEIELARIDQRLNYLRARIARAIVVDPASVSNERVHFGSVVVVRDENGQELTYTIVGEDETDPDRGRVSWVSPLARALMTRSVGETTVWHRPIGDVTLTVVSIDEADPS